MSLDLYSGALGKYYQRAFETPQQRLAREQGWNHSVVYSGEEPDWLNAENVNQVIGDFKTRVFEKIGEASSSITNWDESEEDYHAEQLFHECHAALLILTAYTYRPELVRPKDLPENHESDIAIAEASDKDYYLGPLAILECHLFLPDNSDQIFAINDPMGWGVIVTTTSALRYALNYLKEKVWDDDVMPDIWYDRGPVPRGKVMEERKSRLPWKKKWVTRDVTDTIEDIVLRNAEYAYGVFHKMLDFAENHNVPIKQDG